MLHFQLLILVILRTFPFLTINNFGNILGHHLRNVKPGSTGSLHPHYTDDMSCVLGQCLDGNVCQCGLCSSVFKVKDLKGTLLSERSGWTSQTRCFGQCEGKSIWGAHKELLCELDCLTEAWECWTVARHTFYSSGEGEKERNTLILSVNCWHFPFKVS